MANTPQRGTCLVLKHFSIGSFVPEIHTHNWTNFEECIFLKQQPKIRFVANAKRFLLSSDELGANLATIYSRLLITEEVIKRSHKGK